jgi:tripartite ATP-independent transporter DctP family solute receptor
MRSLLDHLTIPNRDRLARAVLGLGLALAAAALVPACAERGEGDTAKRTVIKMGHGLPTTHPVHGAMVRMAELLETKSGGTMTIEIHPAEQLGKERQLLQQMQLGAVDMAKVSCAVMESFADDYEVLSLPYIFRDEEHAWAVLQGPIGRRILESSTSSSLMGLCFYDAGMRSFYTVDTPINTPDDLAGLKIRVQESPTAKTMVNTLGGSATPISWGELYSALQQGVVDGAENNPPSLWVSNHYEVAKFYSLNEHTAVPDVVLVSTILWNELTPEQQGWLRTAAEESVSYQRELWRTFSDESLAKVQERGVQVIRPDKAPFVTRVQPMLEAFAERDPKFAALLTEIAETQAGE